MIYHCGSEIPQRTQKSYWVHTIERNLTNSQGEWLGMRFVW